MLKFCIKILLNRWDEIRFINFFNALKILKQNKELFNDYDFAKCSHINKLLVRKMAKEFKNNIDKNNSINIIIEKYAFLFDHSQKKYDFLIKTLFSKITNYSN